MPVKKKPEPKDHLKKFVMTSAGVLMVIASLSVIIGLYFFILTQLSYGNNGHYIDGNGVGIVEVHPDTAEISFVVEDTADDVATAQEAVAAQLGGVVASLAGLGITENNIQTDDYLSEPRYQAVRPDDCPADADCPSEDVLVGYNLRHDVSLTIRDLDTIDDVLVVLAEANVDAINGPHFRTENTSAAENEARQIAITRARTQAEQTAAMLGLELKKMIDYTEFDADEMLFEELAYESGGAEEAATAEPQILEGKDTVEVEVILLYKAR